MRIACVHFPQFSLQALVREAPALKYAALAVADETGRTVASCNQAAKDVGVRIGMAVPAARVLGITLGAPATVQLQRAAAAAFDAVVTLSQEVERGRSSGAHHAIFVRVPAGCRGATFGARLLQTLDAAGFVARVGIADDRFTAWVAAMDAPDAVHVIARGGSAAYLADKPTSLLAIPAEVRQMLALGGVTTLGAFAALPPPSVARAWDADYQALARGDGGSQLVVATPTGPVDEQLNDVDLDHAAEQLVARTAMRLLTRGELQKVIVDATDRRGATVRLVIDPVPATATELAACLRERLAACAGYVALHAVPVVADDVVDLVGAGINEARPEVPSMQGRAVSQREPWLRRPRRGRTTHDVVARQALLFAER